MNIAGVLRSRAATCPETTAIMDTRHGRTRTIRFAELDRAAARAAALLRRAGLRPGDAVLVFLPMSAELYVALAALFRLGLVAMFVDPSGGKKHIERCCSLYPPKGLIANSRGHLPRLISSALQRIPVKFSVGMPMPGAERWRSAYRLESHEAIEPCAPETPALLTFTSGSTGQPKAALRTHGFLLAQERVLAENLALSPGEVDLTTLPIFVLANLASGVTSVIPDVDLRHPGSIRPASLVAQVQACHPTRTVASPALLECLAAYCLRHGTTLPSFKKIFTGGAPVFPRLLRTLQCVAPQAEIVAVYGSTEAEPIALIDHRAIAPEDEAGMLGGRGLFAGFPVPTIQLRILRHQWGRPIGRLSREAFAATCLPPGVPGEIAVSGEHVLPGYLHGQGDEETKFSVEGTRWHRTGDAGYLDDRGRLWLLGRCAARIEDAHGILYPYTVEAIAHQHPGVRRAAVVAHGGKRILAIEPDHPAVSKSLTGLTESLHWACIDEIQVHRHIPVDTRHNAKIDYPGLLRRLEK